MKNMADHLQPKTDQMRQGQGVRLSEIATEGAVVSRLNQQTTYAVPEHVHNCGMLFVPLLGGFKIAVENQSCSLLRPGMVQWIPADHAHIIAAQTHV